MNFARLDLKFSSKLGNLFYIVPTNNYDMVGKIGQLIIRTTEGTEKFNESGLDAGISVIDHTLNDYLRYPDGSILEPGETVKAYKINPDLTDKVIPDPLNKSVARYWFGFTSDPGADDSWGIQGYWEIWPDSFPVPNSHNASVNSVQIGGQVQVGVFFPGTQGIAGPPGPGVILDETPTSGSQNPVKGGGIYDAIQNAVSVDVGDEINNSPSETSLDDAAKIALYLNGLKHITGLDLKSLFLTSLGDANLKGQLVVSNYIHTPVVKGSKQASGTLTLTSTSDVTKGSVNIGTMASFDESLNRLALGKSNPLYLIDAASQGTEVAALRLLPNNNGNLSLLISQDYTGAIGTTFRSYNRDILNYKSATGLYLGYQYSVAILDTGKVDIGGVSSPTATLNVKGSAKIQSSGGADIATFRDDGQFYHSGPESSAYLVVTADYTILSSDRKNVLFNPSTPGMVLTMVINPEDGDERTIICPYNATNLFTLSGNGELVEGQVNWTVSPGETLNLKYFTGIGWIFFA